MQSSEFSTGFTYRTAIPSEPNVSRRDPSPVILVENTYHVFYSKSTHDPSGYFATVWHATSPDGLTWTECGEAILAGGPADWDGNGVFTPTALIADGRFWLYYTAVPHPFDNDDGGPQGTPTAIGVAWAESPYGPWRKFDRNPVLTTSESGFDSHRVDDACLIVRNGEYWLYYKGRERGLSPAETKMGLSVARHPTGPFIKHPENPVLNSGHEICVWPHGTGIAALIAPVGPDGRSIQYSEDGIHFRRMASFDNVPAAPGPYREDRYEDVEWGPGVSWGLCHCPKEEWPYLLRFDCNLRAKA